MDTKKSESKQPNIPIPEEHKETIRKLSKEDDMTPIRLMINKAKYVKAIEDGDEERAYELRYVEEKKIAEDGIKAKDALWDAIRVACPDADDLDKGHWSLNRETLDLEVCEGHRHDIASGLLSAMGLGRN